MKDNSVAFQLGFEAGMNIRNCGFDVKTVSKAYKNPYRKGSKDYSDFDHGKLEGYSASPQEVFKSLVDPSLVNTHDLKISTVTSKTGVKNFIPEYSDKIKKADWWKMLSDFLIEHPIMIREKVNLEFTDFMNNDEIPLDSLIGKFLSSTIIQIKQ